MSQYSFQKCSDTSLWDDFVDSSPQGTIFSKVLFTKCLGVKLSNYLVKKGNEAVGGVTILEDKNNQPLPAPYILTPYQGILFKNFAELAVHKRISEEFMITELIINSLMEIYDSISLSHSPCLTDLRPFQWHNYHEPEKGRFDIALRYTGILNLNFSTSNDYIQKIRRARKREYSKEVPHHIYETDDIELLSVLYKKTFSRQNIELSAPDIELLLNISATALKENFGRLTLCEIDGHPASMLLFLFDNKRGYGMFGANDPEFRHSSSNTKLMIEGITFTKEKMNLSQFDVVGCNSPQRGDYKLSFDGQLYPYYTTNLNKTSD